MPGNIYQVAGGRWRYRFMVDRRMVNGPNVATEAEARELFRLALLGEFPVVPRKPHACSRCGQPGHYHRTCGRPPQPAMQPRCKAGEDCDIDQDDPGYCAMLGFCGLVQCHAGDCGARGKWDAANDGCYCQFHRNRRVKK